MIKYRCLIHRGYEFKYSVRTLYYFYKKWADFTWIVQFPVILKTCNWDPINIYMYTQQSYKIPPWSFSRFCSEIILLSFTNYTWLNDMQTGQMYSTFNWIAYQFKLCDSPDLEARWASCTPLDTCYLSSCLSRDLGLRSLRTEYRKVGGSNCLCLVVYHFKYEHQKLLTYSS